MAKRSGKKKDDAKRLSDFLKHKGRAEPLPVYVLRGTDPYLMEKGRAAVRERAIGDADPGLALAEFDGAEAGLADVLDAVRTLPFLADRRLVLIRNAEAFLNAGTRPPLEKYLEEPSPTGVLCLEVGSWNRSTRLARKVTEVGLVVACEADKPNKIPPWLRGEAKQAYGKALTFEAARMLQTFLGDDFAALTHALDALALYVGDAETIEATHVDALVARGHHERVWDLCDAVADGRVARALELLDIFWTEGMAAPQIVGLLRPTYRQLIRVRALAEQMGLEAAMDRARVHRAAFDRVRRAVDRFSADDLADAYQALVDADLAAKTRPDDRMAMETLIHRLSHPHETRGLTVHEAAGR
ncbi:MAG: DNA polymerase III subunit delta [Phycisphaerae bacterium]